MDFRLVVFRPFISEVLVGKVKSQDEDGIRGRYTPNTTARLLMKRAVTMTFFDEVHIDVSQLPAPST